MTDDRKYITIFDWSLLSPEQFEELCYDLLVVDESLGFRNVKWYKDSVGQRGRDIVAERVVETDSGMKTENWIIQCKHYLSGSVSVRDFMYTLLWADRHKSDGVLIMTSSFISGDSKDLVAEQFSGMNYRIEYLECFQLEKLVRAHLELVIKYFSGMYGFDEVPVIEADLNDLDKDSIAEVVTSRGIRAIDLDNKNRLANVLRNVKAVKDVDGEPVPTLAGILLFGKEPQQYLPDSIVQICRFRGENKNEIVETKELEGRLPDVIEKAMEIIRKYTKRSERRDFKTIETFEYPIEAVGEAFVNAIAHREYSISGMNIRVMIFDDRLELESPGGLPVGLTVENFAGRHFARNVTIAQCLSDLGYMDKLGTGILKIKESMRVAGLPNPVFEDDHKSFKVVLYNSEKSEGFPYTPEPVPYVDDFAGRQRELEYLRDSLDKNSVVVVLGVAGIGKTCLAARFVKQCEKMMKVHWHSCEQGDSIETLIRDLSLFFKEHGDDSLWKHINSGMSRTSTLVNATISSADKTSCLLVFDNCETIEDENVHYFFETIAKRFRKSKCLVVSRVSPEFSETTGRKVSRMHLGELDIDSYNEILNFSGMQFDSSITEKVYYLTGGHPYLLKLVIGLARTIPIDKVLTEMITDLRTDLDEIMEKSYDNLKDDEKQLLRQLSIFYSPVSCKALESISSLDGLRETINRLVDSGLVDYDKDTRTCRLHPIAREITYRKIDNAKEMHYEVSKFYLSEDGLDPLRAIDHLCRAEKWKTAVDVIEGIYDTLVAVGLWGEAIKRCKQGIEASRSLNNKELEMKFRGELGVMHLRQGNYAEAISQLELSSEISKKIGDKRGIAANLHHLGMIDEYRGEHEKAREKYMRSLRISEESGDKIGVARTLHQLGNLHLLLEDYDAALVEYQRSLRIEEEIGDRSGIAQTLHQQGIIMEAQLNLSEALEKYQESLEIAEELGDRSGVSRTLHQLASFYLRVGDFNGSLKRYRRSLEIAEELGDGEAIMKTAASMGNLYHNYRMYEEAVGMYERSQELAERLGDEEGMAWMLHNLGAVNHEEGEPREALKKYAKSMKVWEDSDDKQGMATTSYAMAMSHTDLGDFERALKTYDRSLGLCKEIGRDRWVAMICRELGKIYENLGESEKALDEYSKSMTIFGELGDEREIGLTLSLMGKMYEERKMLKEAVQSYMSAANILEGVHAPEYDETMESFVSLKKKLGEKALKEALKKDSG